MENDERQEEFERDLADLLHEYEDDLLGSEMIDSLHLAVAHIVSDLEDN